MVQSKIFNFPKPYIQQVFTYGLPGHPQDSRCNLMFYSGKKKQIIVLKELKDNPGASITNAAEYIPEQLKIFLWQNYNIELAKDAIFIEHYEANHYGDGEDERFASFDRSGRFQHLSVDRLNLIFAERAIAWLDSWEQEILDEGDEDELDITYRLRGSPFVEPILDTWTIYKNIEGFSDKFVAVRRLGGYAYLDKKSDLIIKDSIDQIRDFMEREGRVRREAVHNEEDTIIEIWI